MRGPLAAEFYYIYAMDEHGGEWKGKAFMCTRDREFRIIGREDCFVRGFDRSGFFEVDTGKEAKNWTVQLTDAAQTPQNPYDLLRARLECGGLRRCKIIATLGPASANPAMVSALFHAGADLFRINMSHASHDQMRSQVEMIRALQEECGRPIGILIDLQGPKTANWHF